MNRFPLELAKLLYARFASMYGDKFVKNYHDKDFIQIWWDDWSEGLAGIDPSNIKEALSNCRLNLEWPPSLAEFRKLCEKAAGYPSFEQSFAAALRNDFYHPLIKIAYDLVGEWSMKHGKEDEVRKKFETAYEEAIVRFRSHPDEEIRNLEEYKKSKVVQQLPAPKVSRQEAISWRKRYADWQLKSEEDRKDQGPILHPVYEQDKITIGHPNFDENRFKERKDYLLNLSERDTFTLDPVAWYDRVRYLREIEAKRYLSYVGYKPTSDGENVQQRASNARKTVFKDWMN